MADFINGWKDFSHDSGLFDATAPITNGFMSVFQSSTGFFNNITGAMGKLANNLAGILSGDTLMYLTIAICGVAGAYGISMLMGSSSSPSISSSYRSSYG
jgi:hypothetical protein